MLQIRKGHRLLVIIGVVAVVQIGTALISQPVSAQTADGWEVEFTGGFGDSSTTSIRSLAEFDGTLYAGTLTSGGCKVLARGAYPSRSAWGILVSDGWGDGANIAATTMEDFTYTIVNPVTALYVGTINHTDGGEIWQFNLGVWYPFNTGGFGNSSNFMITDMEVFNDKLFAATGNTTTGAEIWNFSGITWYSAMTGGFGTPDNTHVSSLTAFDGKLYASTLNPNGGDIWESLNGFSWSRTVPEGFFDGNGGGGVETLATAGGALYALVDGMNGVRVWRIAPGTPVAVSTIGFGDSENMYTGTMISFGDELYVGTHNATTGGEIWRLRGGAWTQENTDGFGDTSNISASAMVVFDERLLAGIYNVNDGAELWRLPVILADGFESGGTEGWSSSVP